MARKPRKPKEITPEPPIVEVDEVTEQQPEPTMVEAIKEIHGSAEVQIEGKPTLAWFKAEFDSKSAAIRYCKGTLNMEVKDISKLLGIRYQQVRNVLTNPVKRGVNEPAVPKSQRLSAQPLDTPASPSPSNNPPSGQPT